MRCVWRCVCVWRCYLIGCIGLTFRSPLLAPLLSLNMQALSAQGGPPSQGTQLCLQALCKDPRNTVVILSGRERTLLEEWFKGVDRIGLCAEHGFYYRVPSVDDGQWSVSPPASPPASQPHYRSVGRPAHC